MTREQALQYVDDHFYWAVENSKLNEDQFALLRLRLFNNILPEIGVDGSKRDESDWVFIDMWCKNDTCSFGGVYYFKDCIPEHRIVWVDEREVFGSAVYNYRVRSEYVDLEEVIKNDKKQ